MANPVLKQLAHKARKAGFKVAGGQNGGGWIALAASIGVVCETKLEAKKALRRWRAGLEPQEVVEVEPKVEVQVKPRRLFPELALDINNLQVLCEVCNHGKGNWDMTDWRQTETEA